MIHKLIWEVLDFIHDNRIQVALVLGICAGIINFTLVSVLLYQRHKYSKVINTTHLKLLYWLLFLIWLGSLINILLAPALLTIYHIGSDDLIWYTNHLLYSRFLTVSTPINVCSTALAIDRLVAITIPLAYSQSLNKILFRFGYYASLLVLLFTSLSNLVNYQLMERLFGESTGTEIYFKVFTIILTIKVYPAFLDILLNVLFLVQYYNYAKRHQRLCQDGQSKKVRQCIR
ncbi:hypothetical protein QR680_011026 [Steinernema hermaphroditum]|uniref:G-protein coupled receptors family 1 profile domain-containing protein n=1 Tax=Steinernema hermaphroditum TaxID=289476 RepID=A0AA39ISD0_9BILA|nr:hypothetical protein QR680_011026 [Steinernema hermaphroditum]